MNIKIISIGKFNKSLKKDIFDDYLKKNNWKISLIEIDIKLSNNLDVAKKKNLEAELILKNCDKFAKKIILDEKAKQFKSVEFAKMMQNYAINGDSTLNFIIGGADGLSDDIIKMADKKISLSLMTFPHMMVRVILAEQLYRAYSIINNHPYHRE